MDVPGTIRKARRGASLTQAELGDRVGTSQATISAYEAGKKAPSVETLSRLLAAAGYRLTAQPGPAGVRNPSEAELARAGDTLAQVISLAESLPARHEPTLRYPRLSRPDGSR